MFIWDWISQWLSQIYNVGSRTALPLTHKHTHIHTNTIKFPFQMSHQVTHPALSVGCLMCRYKGSDLWPSKLPPQYLSNNESGIGVRGFPSTRDLLPRPRAYQVKPRRVPLFLVAKGPLCDGSITSHGVLWWNSSSGRDRYMVCCFNRSAQQCQSKKTLVQLCTYICIYY